MRRVLGICAWALLVGCSPAPEASERAPAPPASEKAPPEAEHASEAGPADATKSPDAAPSPVGTTPPEWITDKWAHGDDLVLEQLRGKVVVVRFWTDTCPYCRKSLPALAKLHAELAEREDELVFVGMFHEKPMRATRDWKETVAYAESLGVTFPLAWDHEWRTLRSWWLDGRERVATSVTFVIGKDGRVAHVHPGPVYFPSEDPADAKANADFLALREAINAALGPAPK